LKERAYAADGNLFRQIRNGSAGDPYNVDLEELDEDDFLDKGNRSNSHSRRIISDYDKQKLVLREKEERRQKYAKYIKEINLPLELDRKELKKEASRQRLAYVKEHAKKQYVSYNIGR